MKTESMIDILAAEAGPVPRHVAEARFATAGLFGIAVATAIMLAAFGVQPDIESAAQLPMFWFKLLFPAAVAVAAMWMAARLSRPGARVRVASVAVALPFVVLWLMAAGALLNAERRRALIWFLATRGRVAFLESRCWRYRLLWRPSEPCVDWRRRACHWQGPQAD